MTSSDDPRPEQVAAQDPAIDDNELDDVAGGRVLGPEQGTISESSSLYQLPT